MILILLSAVVLAAFTVAVHATGIAFLLRLHLQPKGVWHVTRMLLRMIWWLVLLHLAEISIWGLFYLWRGCLPNAEAAFYFSGVTYTTLGYGDVVLAKPWRLLGPVEGLMGVLMCGLSTGFFFVIVSRLHQSRPVKSTAAAIPNEQVFARRKLNEFSHCEIVTYFKLSSEVRVSFQTKDVREAGDPVRALQHDGSPRH